MGRYFVSFDWTMIVRGGDWASETPVSAKPDFPFNLSLHPPHITAYMTGLSTQLAHMAQCQGTCWVLQKRIRERKSGCTGQYGPCVTLCPYFCILVTSMFSLFSGLFISSVASDFQKENWTAVFPLPLALSGSGLSSRGHALNAIDRLTRVLLPTGAILSSFDWEAEKQTSPLKPNKQSGWFLSSLPTLSHMPPGVEAIGPPPLPALSCVKEDKRLL